MDGHQFDSLLTRAIAGRRSVLASLLVGMVGGAAFEAVEGKRRKKKKKKKNGSGTSRPCRKASDCPKNHSCLFKECVKECEDSSQCLFHYYCERLDDIDLDFGLCQRGCDDHGYCETVLGTRLSRCNFSTHQCERIECIFDSDCTPPKTCRDNFTCS